MLHFRSPAVENDLPPSLDLTAGMLGDFGPMAATEFALSGVAQSSVVDTTRGPVLARDLRIGDRVVTRDNGVQAVRWVGSSTVMYPEVDEAPLAHRGPVRIRAGALDTNPHGGNLVLAPGQRVLVRDPMNELLFATDEVMACAGDLTHIEGVDFAPRAVGRWNHVLFDKHEMIRVNDLWMESLSPDMWSIQVTFPDEWEEITTAMPKLKFENGRTAYVEQRLSLNSREARLLNAA